MSNPCASFVDFSAVHGKDPQAIVDNMELSAQSEKQPFLRRSWYSLTFSEDGSDEEEAREGRLKAAGSLLASPAGSAPASSSSEMSPTAGPAPSMMGASSSGTQDPATCEREEANDIDSEASTDVGSDDEDEGGNHAAHWDSDCEQMGSCGVRGLKPSEPSEKKQQVQQPQTQLLPLYVEPRSEETKANSGNCEDDEAVFQAPEDLERVVSPDSGDEDEEAVDAVALAQRRLLKRQRQRQERREQRALARAERSAQRYRPGPVGGRQRK